MARTNAFRSETLTRTLVTVATGSDVTYDWVPPGLPSGAYLISLMVTATVTGTTTDIEVVGLDQDGNETDEVILLGDSADTTAVVLYELVGGGAQEVHLLHLVAGPTSVTAPPVRELVIGDGIRIKITNGTAVNLEQLRVVGVARRIG